MSIFQKYSFKVMAVLMVLAASSCKKDKQDFSYDNRKITDPRKSSSVRIVNLGLYNQVLLDGDTLTNYVVREKDGPMVGKYPGTTYFPENGRLSTTWSIPQGLLKNGSARIQVENRNFQSTPEPLEFPVQENPAQATDYYLLPTNAVAQATDLPRYVSVPRSIAPASNPANFKIRILNLCGTMIPANNMQNLAGPMSLTWADGTPVSSKTNHIQPGRYSEYVELPYTTAQFKVLTESGVQVPGINGEVMDPATSTLISGTTNVWPSISTNLTYAPIKTYAPGGVYTIVITPRSFRIPYFTGNPGEELSAYQNGFRVVTDIAEPVNQGYARLQGVNTLPGTTAVNFRLNGQSIGKPVAYTGYTDYQVSIIGQYKVEATDASGTVLASTTVKAAGNENLSFWLYPDGNGKATILTVYNDLSGTYAEGGTDDATYGIYKQEFPFAFRFLNLCPDMPYLTLTTNNGQAFPVSLGLNGTPVTNLKPGVTPVTWPYIRPLMDAQPYNIMAFRSSPTVVPGTWASDIPVLTGKDLIARTELYPAGKLPNHEGGFYSIALVGSTAANAPAGNKAKMIIVKHSK